MFNSIFDSSFKRRIVWFHFQIFTFFSISSFPLFISIVNDASISTITIIKKNQNHHHQHRCPWSTGEFCFFLHFFFLQQNLWKMNKEKWNKELDTILIRYSESMSKLNTFSVVFLCIWSLFVCIISLKCTLNDV